MHGLVVIEGMTLSGHPWIINEIPIPKYQSQVNWAMTMVAVSQLLMVLFGDRLRFCQERRTRTLGPKCNLHILLSPEQTKHTQLNAFAFGRTQ